MGRGVADVFLTKPASPELYSRLSGAPARQREIESHHHIHIRARGCSCRFPTAELLKMTWLLRRMDAQVEAIRGIDLLYSPKHMTLHRLALESIIAVCHKCNDTNKDMVLGRDSVAQVFRNHDAGSTRCWPDGLLVSLEASFSAEIVRLE